VSLAKFEKKTVVLEGSINEWEGQKKSVDQFGKETKGLCNKKPRTLENNTTMRRGKKGKREICEEKGPSRKEKERGRGGERDGQQTQRPTLTYMRKTERTERIQKKWMGAHGTGTPNRKKREGIKDRREKRLGIIYTPL